MRIGDILFFAPGVKFDEVDLNGTGLTRQFERRIIGFYLEPADRCASEGFPFAAGVILVSCIDALARFRFGGAVGTRFKAFLANELASFSHGDLSTRFYDEFRNGLVHEARIKEGGQFTLDATQTVQSSGNLLLVNPRHLGVEVHSALDRYVMLLNGDPVELQKLATNLAGDLAVDFQVGKS